MATYKVELEGRVYVEADSAQQAIEQIYNEFSWSDLGQSVAPTIATVEEW